MARADDIIEDAALMRRLADGDEAAARTLVDRFAAPLARFASGMLNDAAEGEDIAHEAIMRLWRNAADWRPEGVIGGWLRRSAYTMAVDRIRRRGRYLGEGAEAVIDAAEDDGVTPEQSAFGGQVGAAVAVAMAALPERQRAALLLAHHDGLSGAEIATALDASPEAVESLLSRGRRALRAALTDVYADARGEARKGSKT